MNLRGETSNDVSDTILPKASALKTIASSKSHLGPANRRLNLRQCTPMTIGTRKMAPSAYSATEGADLWRDCMSTTSTLFQEGGTIPDRDSGNLGINVT